MTQAPSFGVRLAGLPVRLPAGTPLEFVPRAALHPLPLAPRRVAGLMQLRGQPIVVLDASPHEPMPAAAAALAPRDVLVVGALPNAAALLVEGAPQPTPVEAPAIGLPLARAGALADCAFFDAIVSHRVAEGDGGEWYEVDPARLFAALLED
ncbi:MAG TPA: hypothetical protein VK047_03560 [Zeimonas sp.]|nr:hypothetical protein [Zeimonas sp.]